MEWTNSHVKFGVLIDTDELVQAWYWYIATSSICSGSLILMS